MFLLQSIPRLHQVENGAERNEKEESSGAMKGSITWKEDAVKHAKMQVE